MSKINSPIVPGKYNDRFLDCQREMDAPLMNLISEACSVGWDADEVVAAVIEVAENIQLGLADTRAVDEMIKRLR